MAGFGLSTAGTMAFGLGTPDTPPDPATGSVGSRWINPATKDYEVDPGTGNLKQMPGVRQQVLLAVSTIQGSATSVPRFGVSMPGTMNQQFEAAAKNSCRLALRHMTDIDPPIIRIDNIKVTKGRNSRAEILIDYVDLTTDEPDQVRV